MKEGWKAKQLQELCAFSSGLWKGEKPPFVRAGVIRNTNFTKDGALDGADIAYIDVEAKKLEKRLLKYGDIILEKSGGGPKQPVGRVALFDKSDGVYSFSNFTAALRVFDPQELRFNYLHRFLFWLHLSGVTEGMQSYSTGIRNLDGNAYKAIVVPYPSIEEQQRIVDILDDAFDGIATAKTNAEKNLQNARAVFESQLNTGFTRRGGAWDVSSLGEIADFKNGLNYTRQSRGQTLPVVGVGDFKDNEVVPLAALQTATIDGELSEDYALRPGDLLTVRSNGSKDLVGRCMLVPEFSDVVSFSGFVIRIRPDMQRVLPRYLLHFMRSGDTRERLVQQHVNNTT